jgi:hypothetical protein
LIKAGLFDEHHSFVCNIESILAYDGIAMCCIEILNKNNQQDEQGAMSGKSILSDVGG